MSTAMVPNMLSNINLGEYARTKAKKQVPMARKHPKTTEDLEINSSELL